MNAATGLVYFYIFGAAIVSICAAQMLEKKLKARLPQTLPYRWGLYYGCMGLACAPFALLFAGAVALAAANNQPERVGKFIVYTAYSAFQAFCGWFIIKRRWWAWVLGTIFSLNIFVWIINAIYGRNRRKELSKKSQIQAAPIPPPKAVSLLLPDTELGTLAVPKPDRLFPQKRKRIDGALLFTLCSVAFCALTIVYFRPWEIGPWPGRPLEHRRDIFDTAAEKAEKPETDTQGDIFDRVAAAQPSAPPSAPPQGDIFDQIAAEQAAAEGQLKRPASTSTPRTSFSEEEVMGNPTQPLTPAEIARAAFPSVVLLSMQDASGQPFSLGSGFFVDKDIVATNFHVSSNLTCPNGLLPRRDRWNHGSANALCDSRLRKLARLARRWPDHRPASRRDGSPPLLTRRFSEK